MDEIKVAYAIWNRRDIYQAEIRDLLRDIDFATDSVIVPKVNHDLMALVSDAADNTDCTHLVIYASGTMIKRSYALDTLWHAHCRSEWLVSGHILLHPNDQYPCLHEQTLAINLQLWKDCGRPSVGHSETGEKILPAFERSADNIHDNYTPLWLKSAHADPISTVKRRLGWNIISTSLANQIPVVNIPIDIRNEKVYVYPEDNGIRLAQVMSELRSDSSLPIPAFENQSQHKFVDWMRWTIKDDATTAIFVFNTGRLWWDDEIQSSAPDSIWTTASGFKSFVEWYMRGAPQQCVIDTYDRNPGSLRLWQHIHRSWNGNDFYDFMLEKHNKDYDIVEKESEELSYEVMDEYMKDFTNVDSALKLVMEISGEVIKRYADKYEYLESDKVKTALNKYMELILISHTNKK